MLLAAAAIPDRPYPCGKRNIFPVGELLSAKGILHEQASGEVSARCAGTVKVACFSWAVISAGEKGRGFAVVAGSIRELSQSTDGELSVIKDIISGIKSDFDECLGAITDVIQSNTNNTEGIRSVINSFESLNVGIASAGDSVGKIECAVERMTAEIQSIKEEMRKLDGVAKGNAAATEEINASIEELSALMHTVDSSADDLLKKSQMLLGKLEVFKY